MTRYLTPIELQKKGMQVLMRELGYPDAIRFMLQFRRGAGDYTKERKGLLAGVTIEQLIAEGQSLIATKPARATRRRKSA